MEAGEKGAIGPALRRFVLPGGPWHLVPGNRCSRYFQRPAGRPLCEKER